MRKQLALFIILFCSLSCASQKKEIIAKSTIKLEGENTNIRNLIEIDGYYYMSEYPDSNNIVPIEGNRVIFFEDGTWVGFSFKRDISENGEKADMPDSVITWKKSKQIRWGDSWGVYKIKGDTLITHFYIKGNFWTPWMFYETRYKVINTEMIQTIYSKSLLIAEEDYDRSMNIRLRQSGNKLYFIPADSLPSSDCWLKEEKWIWRNKSDWEAYMERIKTKKKRY